jgi:hypothetical protein
MKKRTAKRGGTYAAKAARQGADRYGQFREGRRISGDMVAGHLCFAPKADS